MSLDELNKTDLGYSGFTDFEAGAQSRQAEIDDLRERIDNLTNINESLVAYKNQLLDDIEGTDND